MDTWPSFQASRASASRGWCLRCANGFRASRRRSLSYACSPHHTNSALFPFVTQLERAAGFAPDDASGARLEKLKSLLRETADGADARRWHSLPTCSAFRSARGTHLRRCRRCRRRGFSSAHFSHSSRGWRRAARCWWCSRTCTGSIRLRGSFSIRWSSAFSACRCSCRNVSARSAAALDWLSACHAAHVEPPGAAQARSLSSGSPAARRCPRKCSSKSWRGRRACRSSPRN